MSHVVKVKTKLMDKTLLCNALERLQIGYHHGNKTIHGTEAELYVDDHLGFAQQQDNTWTMVGDPYYSSNRKVRSYYDKENQLVSDISNAYAVEEAIEEMDGQGFQLVENQEAKIGDDNLITLVFEQ